MNLHRDKRIRHTRTCGFCGRGTYVLGPEDWDDIDVDAEFSSAGRQYTLDGWGDEPAGMACHRCARKHLWTEAPC